jgi:hypothetical protein
MSLLSAVIDNDALVNLFEINKKDHPIFGLLRNLFNQILIPLEVKNEFLKINEPARSTFIDNLRLSRGFFNLCNTYDTLALMFLKTYKGIGSGEREVAAQKLSTSAHYIISDDRKFTIDLLKYDSTLKIINSLHLLSMIDLNKYYNDTLSLKKLLFEIRPYNQQQIIVAYKQTAAMFGIRLGPKKIKDYTSFKIIGI